MWILVTGPKGAGKSTVSSHLNKQFGWTILSADQLVDTLYNSSKIKEKIRNLFKTRGIELPENFSKYHIKKTVRQNPKLISSLTKMVRKEVYFVLKKKIKKPMNFIIEIPFPYQFLSQLPLSFHPVLTLSLTAPFSQLSKRIKKRDGDTFLLKKTIRYHAQNYGLKSKYTHCTSNHVI